MLKAVKKITIKEKKMDWYKLKDVNIRINLKEMSYKICDIEWKHLVALFGMREAIELITRKLYAEGFYLE